MKDLFSDGSSTSMMRVLSFLTVLAGIGVAIYGLIAKADVGQLAILVGTFLTTGIGGKYLQAREEIKTTDISQVDTPSDLIPQLQVEVGLVQDQIKNQQDVLNQISQSVVNTNKLLIAAMNQKPS